MMMIRLLLLVAFLLLRILLTSSCMGGLNPMVAFAGLSHQRIKWERHVLKYELKFKSDAERDVRREVFFEVDDMIERFNSNGNHTFTLKHNKFSTMTLKEVKIMGILRDEEIIKMREILWSREKHRAEPNIESKKDQNLPSHFDLRSTVCGSQIPIKDQGNICGSCWAFSVIAPIEYSHCLDNDGDYVQLSEQQLVDCTTSSLGCNGGDPQNAYLELQMSREPVHTSASYPYTEKTGHCNRNVIEANHVDGPMLIPKGGYNGIPYDEKVVSNMQGALMANKVLSVCFLFNFNSKSLDPVTKRPFFLYYGDGVFTDPGCVDDLRISEGFSNQNHCASIVGWGTLNGRDYWILRNQWSSSWGDNGYMYIEFGMCGIERSVLYVNTTKTSYNHLRINED